MAEFAYELKIPKDRIAVLIGKNGETKKYIEEETNTVLDIDSRDGDVIVKGTDALSLYSTRSIIKAIGRGFNPKIAQLLLKQDYSFELINIYDYIKENHLKRVKGRLIGSKGKTRRLIEKLSDTFISIYGKTVGIIGRIEDVGIAKRAVISLIQGSPHSNVYMWLEKMRREKKRRQFETKESDFFKDIIK
ncbi:RNA-processing protein [Candidatus Woesearchaeota archaeon]|nr:RNA-processing protein [Candidatus Woesearchaeota archaeon]